MSAATSPVTASPVTGEPALVPIWRRDLAPPFGAGWTRVTAPPPPGYTASAQLDSGTGHGGLTLAARPHPPNAPTTIGWYWAGWERHVDVQIATAFTVGVRCHRFRVTGGGICVPRCFLTLRPVDGGAEYYQSVVLDQRPPGEEPQYLSVVVPQSPHLPGFVRYTLKVHFNLRGVYSKAQNPSASLDATIEQVYSNFAFPFPTATAAADDADRSAGTAPADGDLDPAELAEALAALGRDGQAVATDSDR